MILLIFNLKLISFTFKKIQNDISKYIFNRAFLFSKNCSYNLIFHFIASLKISVGQSTGNAYYLINFEKSFYLTDPEYFLNIIIVIIV